VKTNEVQSQNKLGTNNRKVCWTIYKIHISYDSLKVEFFYSTKTSSANHVNRENHRNNLRRKSLWISQRSFAGSKATSYPWIDKKHFLSKSCPYAILQARNQESEHYLHSTHCHTAKPKCLRKMLVLRTGLQRKAWGKDRQTFHRILQQFQLQMRA
jgi:hypothetical protein